MTRDDRAEGLLLGVALGDALGAPLEGAPQVAEADILADERSTRRLVHTDDTALTLVLARHLAQRRDTTGLEEDVLAHEFAQAWSAEPWRGYGATVTQVFQLLNTGVPWQQATRTFFDGEGSFGNGAAMRVAPIALVGASPHDTAELARRSAVVTHAHQHGKDGAACHAVAAYLALTGDPARPLEVTPFLQNLARVVRSRPWHEKFDRIAELAHRGADPDHAARVLGNDVSALGSVPLALLAFLHNPDDPAAAIRYALRGGGDADTIAAMAGALAGARNGAGSLPQQCVRRLEARQALTELAGRLA
ncbi:ADP-ribosylglycohydrolase family protein [Qaidamihabitans albus]|uniref:ADP-ribosylglycohydrolase family protein n=1 Tax=Qaidamihabitans albus TaxID=2795733 RepID=UPI0018F14366|nr:ADP-ribosylglycohydrolase family protein [Qaidamihabitans albus]